jgi:hypothetical protein
VKIAVCTWNTPNEDWPDLAAIGNPGKKEYCRRHGYDFISRVTPYKNGFQRMELVLELMGEYEAVMNIDADALIMNHTLKIERLFQHGKGLILTEDLFGINDGVFVAVRLPLVVQMLNAYLGLAANSANHQDSQQLLTYVADVIGLYREAVMKVPQREMNSYRNNLYNRPEWFTGTYQPGDWICQYPGMANSVRMPHMRAALEEVIQ